VHEQRAAHRLVQQPDPTFQHHRSAKIQSAVCSVHSSCDAWENYLKAVGGASQARAQSHALEHSVAAGGYGRLGV
jgi:hypothetical protein